MAPSQGNASEGEHTQKTLILLTGDGSARDHCLSLKKSPTDYNAFLTLS